jgi:hypothetical protein
MENMEGKEYVLSTKDNPYSPFTQWDEWLAYDEQHGYYTNAYLARLAQTAEGLSEEQNELEIRHAMEEICRIDPTNNYEIRES